jgi:hypothetical protein
VILLQYLTARTSLSRFTVHRSADGTAGARGFFSASLFFFDFFSWVPRFAREAVTGRKWNRRGSLRLGRLRSREKTSLRQEFRVGSEQTSGSKLAAAKFDLRNFDEISDDLSINTSLCFRLSLYLYPLVVRISTGFHPDSGPTSGQKVTVMKIEHRYGCNEAL